MTPSSSYNGPERRKENLDLEERVRDLEEDMRASTKSRQHMHQQLEDIAFQMREQFKITNAKIDDLVHRQAEKNEACADHHTRLSLLEQAQDFTDGAVESAQNGVKTVAADQTNATRAAAVSLLAVVVSLLVYIWNSLVVPHADKVDKVVK